MKERKVIVTCLVVIVILDIILGGFAYAPINKLNAFNQTKSYLESLGFDISNNVSGVDISTAIKSQFVFPMKDVASFIFIARQYNATTIYEEEFSFYVVPISLHTLITAFEYTPSDFVWWNLGYSDLVYGSWLFLIAFGFRLLFSFKREYLEFRKVSWKFWGEILIECIAFVLLIVWTHLLGLL
jgi:hypothetical protein